MLGHLTGRSQPLVIRSIPVGRTESRLDDGPLLVHLLHRLCLACTRSQMGEEEGRSADEIGMMSQDEASQQHRGCRASTP